MNNFIWETFLPLGQALGWTVLHSIWQIAIICLGIRILLLFIPLRHSQIRYLFLLAGLIGTFIWSAYQFSYEWNLLAAHQTSLDTTEVSPAQPQLTTNIQEPVLVPVMSDAILPTERSYSLREKIAGIHLSLRPYVPLIALSWYLGVILYASSMFFSFFRLKKLRTKNVTLPDKKWLETFEQLKEKMGIKRPVQFLLSYSIQEPITFHIFKPVVLAPVSLLTGLTQEQVEVLLLHELAHIRRYDYLINIFQSIIDIFFFYHPGIWWLSGQIRKEREHACDDLVIKLHGKPMVYAEALTQLHIFHTPRNIRLAMAAKGKKGSFSQRIFRLFGQYQRQNPSIKVGLIILLLLVSGLAQAFFPNPLVRSVKRIVIEQAVESVDLKAESITLIQADENISAIIQHSHDEPIHVKIKHSNDSQGFTLVSEDTNETDNDDISDMLHAIEEGDVETIKMLLDNGMDINTPLYKGRTPLIEAAHLQQTDVLTYLANRGAEVNIIAEDGYTAMLEAAEHGPLAHVKLLAQQNADINQTLNGDFSPLMFAIDHGHEDIALYLINQEADITGTFQRGRPLLVQSAHHQASRIVKALVEAGADVNEQGLDEYTAVMEAAEHGPLSTVEFLVEHGAKLELEMANGYNALSLAVDHDQPEIAEYLIGNGMKVSKLSSNGRPPLIEACHQRQEGIAASLIEQGVDINAVDRQGYTALLEATEHGLNETVKKLVNEGADVNYALKDGHTPLMFAAQHGDEDMVAVLLDHGADASLTSDDGWDALRHAATHGHKGVLKLILPYVHESELTRELNGSVIEYSDPSLPATDACHKLLTAVKTNNVSLVNTLLADTDPNCTYRDGGEPRSPLVAAARNGNMEIVKLLVDADADVSYHAKGDETPLMAASLYGHVHIVQYLVENGANVNEQLKGDGTALLVASRAGHLEIVDYLISQQADVNSQVNGDGTALICAVREGHYEVAKLLLDNGADPNLFSPGDEMPMYHAQKSRNKKMIQLLKSYE